jgi:hypothetical protein
MSKTDHFPGRGYSLFGFQGTTSCCFLWFGAIAQLGERLHRKQEASGSNPLSSTSAP